MDLKNYLLEYVSSGRRKRIGIPVEPDTVLKPGDTVRIKDGKWFDSLEKDSKGDGVVVNKPGDTEMFTEPMTEYLGKKVIVTAVFSKNNAKRSVRYFVCPAEGDNQEELDWIFTNEMLEYI